MKSIINSIKPVIKNSKFVQIDAQAIIDFCQNINRQDFDEARFETDNFLPKSAGENKQIAFAFVYNTINFSYPIIAREQSGIKLNFKKRPFETTRFWSFFVLCYNKHINNSHIRCLNTKKIFL